MNLHNIIIDGVEIGFGAAHQLSQEYEEIGGRSLRRMMNGAGLLQSQWSKLRTIISGSGNRPEGLAGLDYTASLTIKCMAPRSIWSANTTVVLPAARRTDWRPHAYAIVAGQHVPTGVSVSTNTATCTAVSGASGYLVAYYPELTCYAEPPTLRFNGRGVVAGWTLIAEEA
jgi:hypothetical protein